VARAEALRSALEEGLKRAQQEWAKLPARAAELKRERAELQTAAIDFGRVRAGLQACFGSPALERCSGQAVQDLRGYAGGLEPALKGPLEAQIDGLDALRIALSQLSAQVRKLDDDATRARQEIEQLVQDAYHTAQEVDERPLEAARVKKAHIAAWRQVSAKREGVLSAVRSVESASRPLGAQISALRASTMDALALYGKGSAIP